MQGVTLTVAIFGSILVLVLRPAYALAAYVAALVWYPAYLRISIGTIDISVGRIVVTVLLVRCLCDSNIRRQFVWSRLDTIVTLSMAVYVGIYCITYPLQQAIENRGGFLMNTWFTYIAVRLIATHKETVISFVKAISIALATLAILGVIESVTHWRPFLPLIRFRPWGTPIEDFQRLVRWGLARAFGPFTHSIMFGECFVMFLPLIWTLRHQRGYWGNLAYLLFGIAILGALSSMSSGPWVALTVMIFCITMERFKRWAKPVFISLVFSCILIGIASNRPFYHVLASYANPVGGEWWQRVKLIDAAMEHIGEWWLAGYGGKDPGWGELYFHANATDMNNEFLLAGVLYGILGIAALCGVLIQAFRDLAHANNQTMDIELKSLYWSLGSVLCTIIIAWMGVSFFGQMPALFYCILGIIGSSAGFPTYNLTTQSRKISISRCVYSTVGRTR